ncbi:MAG TPA: excisionase family DNA-binding protein [Burkholderiales bacterium]|nr:excisionase family DNA-binding protein [Burkholderiales bacterium]
MSDPGALETRVSTAIAARYLGVTRRHVEALIRSGALPAWDVRRPGARRARFVVSAASIRVLLLERHHKVWLEEPKAGARPSAARARLRS